uniref:Pentacotripeptide-repeat region of PRORP domain-containing protein n=1 Tax=Oryza punctata TaxID=4537 RepID=A0A0E0KWS3_ORYPU
MLAPAPALRAPSLVPRPRLVASTRLRAFHAAAHQRLREPIIPGYSYAPLLQRSAATSDPRLAVSLHAALLKRGLLASSHIFLCNHLLIACFKSRLHRHGLRLLDEMPRRNAVSWTTAITGLTQGGRPAEALALLRRMRRAGIPPNEFTLVSALHASSFVGGTGVGPARQLHALAVRLGFDSDVFFTNSFLAAMVRHGHLADAVQLFDNANARDIVSWNTLLAGFAHRSSLRLCTLWRRMAIEGVSADGFSFSTVLSGLAGSANMAATGLQVHAQLVKSGFVDDVCVGNSLLEMYMRNKQLESGTRAFTEMRHRDVVSWTELASGLLHCGEPAKSLRVVSDMILDGIWPNNYTIAAAASACAYLGSLNEGRKIHGYVIKLGGDSNVGVNNALIDMYAKCRSVTCAYKVFQSMQRRSVVSWTAMIMAFANGQAREAVKVFDDMLLEGIAPNHAAFYSVLYACSQGGFVEEGWIYFDAMADKFGVEPGEDHYACMVDLLTKAGRIEEAEELISRMPFHPGVLA